MAIPQLTDLPSHDGVAITPADTLLAIPVRSLYVGGAGNVRIKTLAGTDLTFVGVPAGTILPVGASQVYTTNTTATSIVGLF